MKINIDKQKPSIIRISMGVACFLLASLFFLKPYYLWFATFKDYSSFARVMLLIGADVDSRNKDNETPLMFAVIWGYRDLIDLYIKSGANLNAQDRFGYSPLINAVRVNDAETIKILLHNRANPDLLSSGYLTPLKLAVGQDKPECVKALIDGGATLSVSRRGKTLLMSASERGHIEVVKTLLSAGLKIDAKDSEGYTALTYAQAFDHPDVVKFLLNKGANPKYKNIYKWEAMD